MLYRQVGPALNRVKNSRAIAVDADGAFTRRAMTKCDFTAEERQEIQLPQEPTGMAFDRDGTLIAALTDHLVF